MRVCKLLLVLTDNSELRVFLTHPIVLQAEKKKEEEGRSATPGDPLCLSAIHPSYESRGEQCYQQHLCGVVL